MKRVLIITDEPEESDRLQRHLRFDTNIHVTVIDARQISIRRLNRSSRLLRRLLRSADLILVEDTPNHSSKSSVNNLLAYLKDIDIPIMVLPSSKEALKPAQVPQLLNMTEEKTSDSEFKQLVDGIRSQYMRHRVRASESEISDSLPRNNVGSEAESKRTSQLRVEELTSRQPNPLDNHSRAAKKLIEVFRITSQLRGPLSNMNLAIHMLDNARSEIDRARYLQLLREEYNRELQLVNQLDDLRENIGSDTYFSLSEE